ncbi:MAG: hypothetical protein R6V47_07720 [Candidatus Delongbacteria bacterium]
MEKTIILIMVGKRRESAVEVQKILTDYGCNIKTRLGIHDGVLDRCSEQGFLMIEFVGGQSDKTGIMEELEKVENVSSELVTLKL